MRIEFGKLFLKDDTIIVLTYRDRIIHFSTIEGGEANKTDLYQVDNINKIKADR